ncbi:hypothetical protein ZIOFF_075843 [Zingiber officinale]|uniref:Potassium transporter n=2 Tax=Zingiber officinale TaxID=94328 RepID=A0A8J5E877_ZINOF|nr:hypothetical protein ZIOFF_075843 [Zingiber officinale]
MFADLGHFSYTAIQIAFTFLVYPSLILAYMGQAAFLSMNHNPYTNHPIGFYASVPECIRWPVLVIAILASVVGSQAIISGTFSIINQSQSLGCFPRVKVIHTSEKIHGQIYIPEINWMLMILCMAVAVGFRDIKRMGNASGLAVITVMLVTTCLTSLVMFLCWQKPPWAALTFLLFFGFIEILYFSASLIKFLEGAWLPILLALFLMTVMFVWHYATIKKYEYDLYNKVSLDWLLALGDKLGIVRVPGIGLVFTDIISGVPAHFSRFVTNLPAFHHILVFVCVKSVPVPFVPSSERFLVGRVGPPSHRSYRCIVRYGYRDVHQDINSFESELIASLSDFILLKARTSVETSSESANTTFENRLTVIGSNEHVPYPGCGTLQSSNINAAELASMEDTIELLAHASAGKKGKSALSETAIEELEDLLAARESGCAFILGHSHVQVKPGSSIMKKLAINVAYNFLKRNCRGRDVSLRLPPASLLEVGMVYVL